MLVLDQRPLTQRPEPALATDVVPHVCVVFATRGRAALLAKTLAALEHQTLQPASIVISCASHADVEGIAPRPSLTIIVQGAPGAAAQRNAALRRLPDKAAFVVFFDDDFLPRADWLEVVTRTFTEHPDVGAITGDVIADGIKGPGLTFEDAERLLAESSRIVSTWIREPYIPYGCNMAFRRSAIAGQSFDERLVLYSWLEDRDFGAALEKSGSRIIKIGAAIGVHMGIKVGRVAGRQLGYSQIVNPIYLHRKGTMPLRAVSDHIFRNLSSNLIRALVPERHIDRRGRLRGNLRGIADVMRGRLTPERAADL